MTNFNRVPFSNYLEFQVDPDTCPYLPDRQSQVAVVWPSEHVGGEEFDQFMENGYRRAGSCFYRNVCPGCVACESLRIPVDRFQPGRTMRRVWNRGRRQLRLVIDRPRSDPLRVGLYNLHKHQRGLAHELLDRSPTEYYDFLVDTCCDSIELQYYLDDTLIGVAIADRGVRSLSAVYCYFDPAHERLSPGTFSVLQHIELCRQWGMQYLYLGFYIAQSPHMNYKRRYLPHERRINGRWQPFERDQQDPA